MVRPARAGVAHLIMGVALTFDDGPDLVWTPRFLDELDRLNVRATFFVQAANILECPHVVQETHARGHQIGAHCYAHRPHIDLRKFQIERDIRRLLRLLARLDIRPSLWRPPNGQVRIPETYEVAARHGLHIVTWTVDTRDWEDRPPEQVMRDIGIGHPKHGRLQADSVVVMHDTHGLTLGLLDMLVAEVRRRGWSFADVGPETRTPRLLPPVFQPRPASTSAAAR